VGGRIELRLGSDWRRTSGETRELFTYVAGLPTRGRLGGGVSETAGLFAETSAKLGALTLTGGIRLDHWSISEGHLTERTLASGAMIRNDLFANRNGWEPTGRAGLAYRSGTITLRAATYLGWRLPTLNELYRPFRVGADATAANAALSPERMKGAEVGLDWKPSTTLNLRTTLFANRLSGAIANVTLGSGPGTFPGVGFVGAGGAYRQRQNLDSIRAHGLEIDAIWQSGDWHWAASYALTSARVNSSGAALPLNGLAATLRYVSSQFEDDLNTRRLKNALTIDGVATLPLTNNLRLTLRGENLADARIETAISATGVIERATPRTIWLGLKLEN
jgi:outer membrane receptor protein involved in Fe transport